MVDTILVTMAGALVTKAVGGFFDLVKDKLARRHEDAAALESAVAAGPGSEDVLALARVLERAEQEDAAFGARLRAGWAQFVAEQRVEDNRVTNQVTGRVSGKVVQARDIQGGVSM
jgi:hypothetical protein